MRVSDLRARLVVLAAAALMAPAGGCDSGPQPGARYYERVIQPILTASCVRQQGGCHLDDGNGNALGNLDLTSYAALSHRGDVLRTYGSYPVPLLLLKGAGPAVPPIPFQAAASAGDPKFYPSEIQHAGGATLSPDSNAYFELLQWMSNGAQEDGSILVRAEQKGTGACNSDYQKVRPDIAAQLSTVDANADVFKQFVTDVEPTLTTSCAYGTCHSSEQSDFFITCAGDQNASKFNFLAAQAWVAANVDNSLLVLKPLAPGAGGIAHTGGVFFQQKSEDAWQKLYKWAMAVGAAQTAALPPAQQFFNDHVMPVFLKRGCALEACHSPGAANDFKLRAGTRGFFSTYTLAANYKVARYEFLAPELPDVRQSRLVKKPIPAIAEGGMGLTHRGGPPLATGGESIDPTACPQPWTEMSSAFCTVVEWHRLERDALLTAGKADALTSGTIPLVVVSRPPDGDKLIEFDTYRPGADLIAGTIPVGALGVLDAAGAATGPSLLTNCPGVAGNAAAVDVRRPDVSYDATKVAFAMRLSAADTLDVYEVDLATKGCKKLTDGNGRSVSGILQHNFDPMYAPDGSLVFASTRGRPSVGPSRSPKYLLPQSDLWRMRNTNGTYGAPEQMTALNGSELAPAMMMNGQLTMTSEKATADFYQLSGRRLNWDLTDYHPLLVQRAQSPGLDGMVHPSVGYQQATEIREAWDRNFLLILSDDGTKGAGGTLATFNRSIGPFEADRNDITFLHSLTVIDPAATGRAGPTAGAYRSPYPLPDGRVLVSYSPDTTDLATAATVRYDLVIVDPRTATRVGVPAFSGAGRSWVEPIVVFKRDQRPLFDNFTQLVFGGHASGDDPTSGVVHYPDLPMLGTLLGANLRTGRFVDSLRGATKVVVYENGAVPTDLGAAMAGRTGSQNVYQQLKMLGEAPLNSDGSVHLKLPAQTPLILELVDGSGKKLFTMSEEDQLGPAEVISRGVPQQYFNSVCGGCHGSVSGRELDIAINPDALTGASVSLARDQAPTGIGR